MFYSGSLQEGIVVAMRESKAVLCFVHDEEQPSGAWEKVILEDEKISSAIQRNTVALRILAGSQEAQSLKSFCPVNTFPAIVVIRNANAKIISHPGSGEKDMKASVLALVNPNTASPSSNATESEGNPIDGSGAAPDTPKEPPIRKDEASTASQQPPPTPRQDWKKIRGELEKQQREERDRIKALIKHDHSERRHKEEARKASTVSQNQPVVLPSQSNQPPSSRTSASEIRLQVRTFDGKSVRSSFSRDATIAGQVRPWIDSVTGSDVPYSLKIILAPQPNRELEAGEEGVALVDLEVGASCTLVMVPVKHFAESYVPSVSGTISSVVAGTFSYLTGTVYSVASGIGTIVGYQTQPPAQASAGSDEGGPKRSERENIRVRTLADQRQESRSNDQQFYNGNQLNFQPRRDNEDGKDS